eukprot:298847-Hanusia_phi.AAC.1
MRSKVRLHPCCRVSPEKSSEPAPAPPPPPAPAPAPASASAHLVELCSDEGYEQEPAREGFPLL